MTEQLAKNILIADDDLLTRTIIEDMLVEAGYGVRLVTDGEDVFDELRACPDGFDLLILDLQMAKLDGFGVLDRLEENGLAGKLPVLVMTGAYEPEEVIYRLKKAGATGMMGKDHLLDHLLSRVKWLLFPNAD